MMIKAIPLRNIHFSIGIHTVGFVAAYDAIAADCLVLVSLQTLTLVWVKCCAGEILYSGISIRLCYRNSKLNTQLQKDLVKMIILSVVTLIQT